MLKLLLSCILGVVLGFGLNYAVVRHQFVMLARRCSIQGLPDSLGRIHNFVIGLPDGCTIQANSNSDSVVTFSCLSTSEGPEASLCPTQLYDKLKHPKLTYAEGKQPISEEPTSGPYAKVLVLSATPPDFSPYLGDVMEAVRQNWYGPIAAEKKYGGAEINLIILSDGKVDRVKLTSPSRCRI